MQHDADVTCLTGCQGHHQRRSLVASNADQILARTEVTIKAGSWGEPVHWHAIDGDIVVDVSAKSTDGTKNVEPAHAIGDRAFLWRYRLLSWRLLRHAGQPARSQEHPGEHQDVHGD